MIYYLKPLIKSTILLGGGASGTLAARGKSINQKDKGIARTRMEVQECNDSANFKREITNINVILPYPAFKVTQGLV